MRTVDLSHPLATGMPVYPGTDPVDVEPATRRARDGYRTTRLDLDSHAGTHVDAPAHLIDGPGLDGLPLDRFRFEAVTAGLRERDPNERIGLDAVRNAVSESIADVDIVVVATGWDRHWGTERYFEHPWLAPEVGSWLAERGCDLGIDAINPDPTPSGDDRASGDAAGFPVHEALFEEDRLIVENLRGLDRVPDRFELHAYPLRFADADASPVRAAGLVES